MDFIFLAIVVIFFLVTWLLVLVAEKVK